MAPLIEVSLFGPVQARVDGARVHLATRKVEALFAYLAREPGRPHDRQAIRALLWPDSGKVQAQASLRQALLTLRKALSACAPSALQTSESTVAIDAAQVEIDVAVVESGVGVGTRKALERVASVCQRPFLEGFVCDEHPFDDWVVSERAKLLEMTLAGLEKLAVFQTEAGQVDRAIETVRHSLRLDPFRERAHRTLMRLYASNGRRAEAAQQYDTCASTLRRELGVEPDERTTRLYREIVQPTPTIGVSRALQDATPARCPIVGRDAEMIQLERAVEQAWVGAGRLVVLRGEAAAGKTRLAEAVTARAVERGGVLLIGRGFESEQVLPFAIWVDLLRSEPVLVDEVLRRLPPAKRSELARLVPFGGESDAFTQRPSNDARPLFEAVGELLSLVAERAPVLVLLEDMHWADAMSVRLLSFLARRLQRSTRVCLMMTLRPEEMGASTLLRSILQEVNGASGLLAVEVVLDRPDEVSGALGQNM